MKMALKGTFHTGWITPGQDTHNEPEEHILPIIETPTLLRRKYKPECWVQIRSGHVLTLRSVTILNLGANQNIRDAATSPLRSKQSHHFNQISPASAFLSQIPHPRVDPEFYG